MQNLWRRTLAALAAVGPGLFLIGYNIGTGSVTTMAKSGAEHGMALFWAVVLSCVLTYILMVAYGRVTLVTGQTALSNFRAHIRFGTPLAIYVMAALILGELLALMGIMGIVGDLLQEASRLLLGGEGIDPFWMILACTAGIAALLWYGRYKFFEKILTVLVVLMALCFLLELILLKPNPAVLVEGLIPSIPNVPGAAGLVAAIAGTTCSAAVFIMRSIVVSEKGWTANNLEQEKRDALVSAGMMLVLSGAIMAVAAGTLHVMGLRLDNTVEMVRLFEPMGGTFAALVLILGVTGAGLSSAFPIILIAPWLICDYTGRPRDLRTPLFRILGLVGILFAFGSQLLSQRPPALMVFSQAFQACILPAVVVPILILINSKKVMGKDQAGAKMNAGLLAALLFSIVTTYFAITELLAG
jgi:Mn2+/Fe2+ NRAMP family transporter